MKNRVNKICHPRFLKRAMEKLLRILLENGYPKRMVSKLLYSSSDSQGDVNVRTIPEVDNVRETKFSSIMNIKGLTHKIKKCFVEEEIKIAVYNHRTVKKLYSRLKDPIPTLLQSNVVYKIECQDCSRSYIGQTSQLLKNRIAIHKSDIRKENKRCALTAHALQEDHKFLFENTEILEKQTKYNKRTVLEMIHINNEHNAINKKSDTQNLSAIYTYLLTHPNKERFYDGPVDE